MFSVGQVVSKYTLLRRLGKGGFGEVFVARDSGLERDVALKLLLPEHTTNADVVQRFLREARSAARVSHPGIVTIHECGSVGDVAFIAMELLSGESLASRLERLGRIPEAKAVEIVRQATLALEAAHAVGIVHRDLKPDNLFLVPDSAIAGGERVKLLDFGIAKLAGNAQTNDNQTALAQVFGTPHYMSPEQCRSTASADARSDIYSMGCVLYQLVSGRPPFSGDMLEIIGKQQFVEAPALAASHGLSSLVADMLAKAPEARPSVARVVERLEETAGKRASVAVALAETMPPTIPPKNPAHVTTMSSAAAVVTAPKAGRRGWLIAVGIGVVVLATGALAAVKLSGGGEPAVGPTNPAAVAPHVDVPAPAPVTVPPPVDAAVDAVVVVDAPVDAAPAPQVVPKTRPPVTKQPPPPVVETPAPPVETKPAETKPVETKPVEPPPKPPEPPKPSVANCATDDVTCLFGTKKKGQP